MNKKDIAKEIANKCFGCGQGGLYFHKSFNEAIVSHDTIEDIAKGFIKDDIWEEKETIIEEFPNGIDTYDDAIKFLSKYMKEWHSFNSFPESFGQIAGVLFRDEKYEDIRLLLDFDKMDNDEQIIWDS